MSTIPTQLLELALEAKSRALAPYSHFRVGAALRTAAGKIYQAGNIETSSYGLTLCAERVVLFKALSEGERDFSHIAIATDTDTFCTPCGACRQVLWDYARSVEIVLINSVESTRFYTLRELLPDAFGDATLKNKS